MSPPRARIFLCGGNAIHHRHLDIEHNDIVVLGAGAEHGILAMFNGIDHTAHAAEKRRGQDSGRAGILRQKHSRRGTIAT